MFSNRFNNLWGGWQAWRNGVPEGIWLIVLGLLATPSPAWPQSGRSLAGHVDLTGQPRVSSASRVESQPVPGFTLGAVPMEPPLSIRIGESVGVEAVSRSTSYRLPPVHPVRPAGFTVDAADEPTEAAPRLRELLPLPGPAGPRSDVQLHMAEGRISLSARDAPLDMVLALIADQQGLNVVTGVDVNDRVTVKLTDVPFDEVLDVILSLHGYTWTRRKSVIVVSRVAAEQRASPAAQGREVRVFSLNYITSTDVEKIIQGLLSPVGQSFITSTTATDPRRTREQLVVEDLPEYLQRIESYLRQADTPPRQVAIEAHVLQVELKDNWRHGINWHEILHIANSDVTLATHGFATGPNPFSSVTIKGPELDGLLELIKNTTDAKTLASPRLTVLNNQEAQMQVGNKIGYLLTTTTQTSTLQSVNFLDVGVILKVTPTITDDGQILLQVQPQVSTGRISPITQLPESETNEVDTRVLLADGEALVIGGLIRESDADNQNKVPWLGDLWLIGWLFQRREVTRSRSEIIVAIVPRILPDVPCYRNFDPVGTQRVTTPLLYGPLLPMNRSHVEASLPCYTVRPRDRWSGPAPEVPGPMFEYAFPEPVPAVVDGPYARDGQQ